MLVEKRAAKTDPECIPALRIQGVKMGQQRMLKTSEIEGKPKLCGITEAK